MFFQSKSNINQFGADQYLGFEIVHELMTGNELQENSRVELATIKVTFLFLRQNLMFILCYDTIVFSSLKTKC